MFAALLAVETPQPDAEGTATRDLIVASGLSVALVGAVTGAVYKAVRAAWASLWARFFVEVTLNNNEEPFSWVEKWLEVNGSLSAQRFRARTSKRSRKSRAWWMGGGACAPELEYPPGDGMHVVRFEGRPLIISRSSSEPMAAGHDNSAFVPEFLSIQALSRSSAVLTRFLEAARKTIVAEQADKTVIFTLARWAWTWKRAMLCPPRPRESVLLDSGLMDELVGDAQRFFDSEQWYAERGIPYRRGYLLYGPPGCGKSSFARVLAGALGLNICVLVLSNKDMDDEDLCERLRDAPSRSIILLEDVDAVFTKRESQDTYYRWYQRGVTFSGLLNAIDGVASQEGKLMFLTSNHPERLDAALVRPGRCDVKVKFDNASSTQIHGMFARFFPDAPESAAAAFAAAVPDKKLSMAQIQGFLMRHKNDAAGAAAAVHELLDELSAVRSQGSQQSVARWLTRLGLEEYAPCLAVAGIYTMDDLKELSGEGELRALGIAVPGHAKKIAAMLAGREDVKAEFETVTKDQARALFAEAFPGDADAALADRFAADTPPDAVSVAMVRKHCAAHASAAEAFERRAALLAPAAAHSEAERERELEATRRTPLRAWLCTAGLGAYALAAELRGVATTADLLAVPGGLKALLPWCTDEHQKRFEACKAAADASVRRDLAAGVWAGEVDPAELAALEPDPAEPVAAWLGRLGCAQYAAKAADMGARDLPELRRLAPQHCGGAWGVDVTGDCALIKAAAQGQLWALREAAPAPAEALAALFAEAGFGPGGDYGAAAEAVGATRATARRQLRRAKSAAEALERVGEAAPGFVSGGPTALSDDDPAADALRAEAPALEQYAAALAEHGIRTVKQLRAAKLTDEDLKEELGVGKLAHRKGVLRAAAV